MKNLNLMGLIVLLVFFTACKENQTQVNENKEIVVISNIIIKEDRTRFHEVPTVFLAEKRANLSFLLSGSLQKSWVKLGDKVEEGDILVSLYNANIDPALQSNRANLESIQAQIVQARRDVSRLKELRKNNSTSKNAYESKQTELKGLVARKKSIVAQIDLSLANQADSIIKAPFSGIITNNPIQAGEFVAAGQVVVSMVQQDVVEVEVNLTFELWKSLSMGDLITATYKDKTLDFTVTELGQNADEVSKLMKVILRLNQQLKPVIGQHVFLQIPQKYTGVYQLPLEVVVDDGINNPYIFVVDKGRAKKVQIQPLYIEQGLIVFTTSEDIQNPVVVKGQSKISQGMKIKEVQ